MADTGRRAALLTSGDWRLRFIFQQIHDRKMTMAVLAHRAGIHVNTFKGWREHQNPTITDFIAVINALGYDLKIEPLHQEK